MLARREISRDPLTNWGHSATVVKISSYLTERKLRIGNSAYAVRSPGRKEGFCREGSRDPFLDAPPEATHIAANNP